MQGHTLPGNIPVSRNTFAQIINTGSAEVLIITSQLPVVNWYDIIGDDTIADAILDRLVHTAYRIELNGESLRKKR
jgi:DNA replication protein DnaC